MRTELNLTCPVSAERVNASVVRTIAIFITIIALFAVILNNYFLTLFLVLDFFSRAFFRGKGSLLKNFSFQLVKKIHLKSNMIDAAPKAFAAKIGFGFSIAILLSQLLNWYISANIFAGILSLCALLEGIFEICLGCYFYTFYHQLKQRITDEN